MTFLLMGLLALAVGLYDQWDEIQDDRRTLDDAKRRLKEIRKQRKASK